MKNKLTQRELQYHTMQEHLRKCVQKVISEKGIENTTVRDICKEANVSIGTFYHYYKSREDVVLERYNIIDNYFENEVKHQLTSDDAIENILKFASLYARYSQKVSGIAMAKQILKARLIQYNEIVTSKNRPLYIILQDIISEGQTKHQLRVDLCAEQIAEMLIVMLRGYCLEWCTDDGIFDLEERMTNEMAVWCDALREKL